MRSTVFATLLAIMVAAAAQVAVWHYAGVTVTPPDVDGPVQSLSFSPFGPNDDAEDGGTVAAERIDSDLGVLSDITSTVRIYSTTQGLDQVPELARKHGLYVSVGAWVDKDETRSREEIERAVALARENYNVRSVFVGNEAVMREDIEAEDLATLIREVKRRVSVPVTTGEVWHVWMDHPELVREVDFIAAHILPYWEEVPADQVLKVTFERYEMLRQAYPGKKVVIAEFGWPSQGYNNGAAIPGAAQQADLLREFLREARYRGVDYNIIEAFDQPWKVNEGSVGAYWGLFDADRHLKFELEGPVEVHYRPVAAGALALGALLTWVGLRRRQPTVPHAILYGLAANGFAAGIALAAAYPFSNYINWGTGIMWGSGLVMVLPLAIMTLVKVNEIGEVLLGRRPQRLIRVGADAPVRPADKPWPMVSVHIPAYKEPPAMLNHTLDTVADLDYPDFEALVIINNTPEEKYWKPVAEHIEALNARLGKPVFKFVFLPKVAGFKAGAMTLALEHMDPRAEVIALIDADYAVDRAWLRDLIPAFDDASVALVQAPQDHRDGTETPLKTMMNWEYAGFFDIGMVQRNEDNAIVAHGTMLMLRRSAFEQVGGWSSDTIVEDTELGLRLFEAGWQARYTNRRYGWGLLPDTFKAFKTQRHRWAYGAVQIIKKHARHMLPSAKGMTSRQKEQFVAGWTFWLSDALGVAVAVMNLIWVPVIVFIGMTLPMMALTLPILTAFVVNVLHCVLLYRKRVGAALPQILGAALAAMSLQLTVGQAVLAGLIKDSLPFARTDKGGNAGGRKKGEQSPVLWETVLGLLLLAGAATLYLTNSQRITEQNLFAATVAVQAIPFLSATLMRGIERSQGSQHLLGRLVGWLGRVLARGPQTVRPASPPSPAATPDTP